uniref:Uncharacterized protein n=1 Tax=Glossina palpalis gambiensis TaxID=67801 RepID=A0A1B0BG67_9MUSC
MAEKLLRKSRIRHIIEVTQECNSIQTISDEAVESSGPRHRRINDIQRKSSGINKIDEGRVNTYDMGKNNIERNTFKLITSLVGQPGTTQMAAPTIPSAVNRIHGQLSTATSNTTPMF